MQGLTVPQLAWAAGFLEGEGSFGAHGGTPRVSAGQVQKEPLDRLAAMFGGHMWIKHPKENVKIRSAQPIWIWSLNSRRSAAVMMTLYSFMSPVRKAQIESSIKTWKAAKSMKQAGSRLCLRGHLIEGDNAYFSSGRTYPQCKACKTANKTRP